MSLENISLDAPHCVCAIVIQALLDGIRDQRRAKLAEVAALERQEQALLTIHWASSEDEQSAPPQTGRALLQSKITPPS
jgi:hypothetical protein